MPTKRKRIQTKQPKATATISLYADAFKIVYDRANALGQSITRTVSEIIYDWKARP